MSIELLLALIWVPFLLCFVAFCIAGATGGLG